MQFSIPGLPIAKKVLRILVMFILIAGIGFTLAVIVLLFIFSSHFDIGILLARQQIVSLDDSDQYIIYFSEFLGSDWKESSGISQLETDVRGYASSVAGTSRLNTVNEKYGVGITQYITTYSDHDNAINRFRVQSDWIFKFDFGVPPSQQIFSYEPIELSINTNPNSDDKYLGCKSIYYKRILFEIKCGGLFLYDNHTVFIDILTMRNGTKYISDQDLEHIFSLVDQKMISK